MNIILKLMIIISMGFTFISCESDEKEVLYDSPFYAKIDKRYHISDEYSFIIKDINDSRCPEGALCFWQGMATIYIEFNLGHRIDTSLNTMDNGKCVLGFYSISLGEISPYPHIDSIPEKENYRIELFVEHI